MSLLILIETDKRRCHRKTGTQWNGTQVQISPVTFYESIHDGYITVVEQTMTSTKKKKAKIKLK